MCTCWPWDSTNLSWLKFESSHHFTCPVLPILPGFGLPKPEPEGCRTIQIKSTKVCCRVPRLPCITIVICLFREKVLTAADLSEDATVYRSGARGGGRARAWTSSTPSWRTTRSRRISCSRTLVLRRTRRLGSRSRRPGPETGRFQEGRILTAAVRFVFKQFLYVGRFGQPQLKRSVRIHVSSFVLNHYLLLSTTLR